MKILLMFLKPADVQKLASHRVSSRCQITCFRFGSQHHSSLVTYDAIVDAVQGMLDVQAAIWI
jgi:hypothetical protein